jgi:hypothetical protein
MRRRCVWLVVLALFGCQADHRTASQPIYGPRSVASGRSSLHSTKVRPAPRQDVWESEDHALRIWVACARGRGRELGLTSQGAADALAATALDECGRQEAAYAQALKAMRIDGTSVAVRNDLAEKISQEISDVRSESRGHLEAERAEEGSATASASGLGP